jgi:peptidoglycan/LPS O-acetylase OafA/YrhL
MQTSEATVQSVRDTRGRFRGIDTIRALSAATVVLGHFGFFSSAHSHSHYVPDTLIRVLAFLWNGPAAVIVFFIISGFCIHLPYRGGRPIHLPSYLSRRLLRIGVPALFAIGFALAILHVYWILSAVLWSILCEIVYYILYPLLRRMGQRYGWLLLIAITYLAGLALVMTHLHLLVKENNAYTALGFEWTWLLGLPVWLMGCWLAEHVESFPVLSRAQLWALRCCIVLLSIVLRVMKFHMTNPVASNCITLNLFALAACLWIGCEIQNFEHTEAPSVLEWAGTWSYSLYLVHPMVPLALGLLPVRGMEGILDHFHFALLLITFPLAYVFYRLVEKPSHLVAVKVSRAL